MNNTIIFLFSILNIVAELTELAYDAGAFTRQYILPIVVRMSVGVYHYGMMGWDYLTTQEWSIKVYNTPLTTGLA